MSLAAARGSSCAGAAAAGVHARVPVGVQASGPVDRAAIADGLAGAIAFGPRPPQESVQAAVEIEFTSAARAALGVRRRRVLPMGVGQRLVVWGGPQDAAAGAGDRDWSR